MPSSLWFIPLWWEVINSCPLSFRRTRNASISQNYQRMAYAPNVAVVISELWDYEINSFFFFFCLLLMYLSKSKTCRVTWGGIGITEPTPAWFSLEFMEASASSCFSVLLKKSINYFLCKNWNTMIQSKTE